MGNGIYRATRGLGATILALLLSPLCMLAQDTIRANPNAVPLRRIWGMRGGFGDGIGNPVAALPDLNGDGRNEFAVSSRGDQQWRIYSMDEFGDAHVLWQRQAESPYAIKVGRFHGGERMTLVYPREVRGSDRRLFFYDFHAIEDGQIADTAAMTWSSTIGDIYLLARVLMVADLDVDGDDELILAGPASIRNDVVIENGEIWIYAGGPDFQIDMPTVVVRDDEPLGRDYALHVGRLDDDEYPELVAISSNGGRIRWGGENVADLDGPVDRKFEIGGQVLDLLDADGDSMEDFLWRDALLHLSSSGKDPRTRPYGPGDADRRFIGRGTATFVVGPLNDSGRTYDMFGLNEAMGRHVALLFSGGSRGPDARYDATYSSIDDGLGSGYPLATSRPAGDVDGDGWSDVVAGDIDANGGGGIAVVLGGGRYIPRDSMPPSAIRDIAIDGRATALTVWPMPASDVVHIAWRGDLARTPASFAVHDELGRLVARGEADRVRGEVVWNCGAQPAGAYLLTVFDRARSVIATVPVVKQ